MRLIFLLEFKKIFFFFANGCSCYIWCFIFEDALSSLNDRISRKRLLVDFVFLTNAKATETRPAYLCSARVQFHKRKVRDPKSATATIKL